MSFKNQLSLLTIPAILSFSSLSFAQAKCESDVDCGEYLSCAEQVDADASRYCMIELGSCQTDSDCPRDFECEVYDSECPDGCAPEENCDVPAACFTPENECVPRQIACDTDDVCPADWTCFESVTGVSCSDGLEPGEVSNSFGGDSSGGDCTETLESYCIPVAWLPYIDDLVSAGGEVVATDNDAENENDASSRSPGEDSGANSVDQGGGCSVAQGKTGTDGWIWMLLMSAPLFLRRRRTV